MSRKIVNFVQVVPKADGSATNSDNQIGIKPRTLNKFFKGFM